MLEAISKLFSPENNAIEDLKTAKKHLDALPILIDYIKDQAFVVGDSKAFKVLDEWDKARK